MIDGEDGAPEGNFAEFEAAANSGEPLPDAKEPEKAKEPVEGDDDTGEDDPNVNDKGDEEGEDKDEGKGERRRSKPAHQRIAELTAARREAERERDELREQIKGKPADKPVDEPIATTPNRPDPNAKNDDGSDKYEFGEADPEYQADLMDWKVEAKLAERDAKDANEKRLAGIREVTTKLDTDWAAKAEAAVERYPDFKETVLESAAAGDWECGPIMAIVISASEQGADIAYHMATNPKEAAELNKLAQTDPMEAARRFGRLEARFEAQTEKPAAVRTTNAPEPPQHRARGGSGKFEVSGDTTDFPAFEAKANAALASGRR